jgi:cell division protein FtsI/penicillin-binding protein 2
VAVANGTGNNGLNLALTASVPPGSTFKTVSSLALIDAGKITADTPQDCPKTFTVGGRTFKNSGDESFGKVPFKTEFAKSCNNAFTQLAPQLGPTGLADTAKTLGIGIDWDLGTDAFTGKVSANGDPTEQAAASFGQGTTVVSPIVMAGAAAAVARGQWKQPVLITDPAPAKPAPDGPALKQTSMEQLRIMMREVVLDGTASTLKGIPGSPLYGKTGTAEFDSNDPTKTHSWFIGYKGDYAFAVFVENGGASTDTAVPLAGKFLQTLGV